MNLKPVGMDEQRLIRQSRAGDLNAYGSLIRCYQPLALRTAFLVTRHGPEAEDAVQEAFVKAWLALDRFHEGKPFRPWLMRIVTNEARDRARAAGRRSALARRATETRKTTVTAISPEDRILRDERLDDLI